MLEVVGVRFKKAGKIYYFDPDQLDIKKDDFLIVETARGIECGRAVIPYKQVMPEDVVMPLKKVLRIATSEDMAQVESNREEAKAAFQTCLEKIGVHRLPMKLIDVEYTFDRNKIIFYFTADGRVDFRMLVKDLANVFRTRIELRQIGVRDEAKLLNGIGPCGRTLCCSTFLGDFQPVSIKMAKDQNLSLNPSKISGVCGRLMCCLKYEEVNYQKSSQQEVIPDLGTVVETPLGPGKVVDADILERLLMVELFDSKKVLTFPLEEVTEATEVSRI